MIFNKNTTALARAASESFAKAVAEILAKKDYAVVAIPGGRSVIEFFKVLKKRQDIDWEKIHFFMLDERLVGLEDEDSNFRQAYEQFFSGLVNNKKLSWRNLHPFSYQPRLADKGVASYEKELKKFGGKYDIVVAGVGEDGHTAALFSNHSALQSKDNFITFTNSPKQPAGRMSASPKLIASADCGIIIFIGQGKEGAYRKFIDDLIDWHDCPSKIFKKIKNLYVITNFQ